MIKIRKLIETTVSSAIEEKISTQKKSFDLETVKDVCLFICENFDKELSGVTERALLITLRDAAIVGAYLVGMGDRNSVNLDPQDHIRIALEDNADYVIAVHNHPTERPVCISVTDIITLNKMSEIFSSMGIKFASMICNKDMSNFNLYKISSEKTVYDTGGIIRKVSTDENGRKEKINVAIIKKTVEPLELSVTIFNISKSREVKTAKTKKTSKTSKAPAKKGRKAAAKPDP
jgi:hypothetical protein